MYISVCSAGDLTQWSTPRQLLASAVFEGRTECLPCAGGLWGEKEKTMKLLVHRYIRMRMSPRRKKVAEGERLEWHLYRLRVLELLWHSMAEP